MEAKEPTTAYYSKNMVNALKRNIRRRVDEETDPSVLSEISRLLDKDKEKEPFEMRYQRAKEFAYSRFDEEYAKELETHNFYIGEAFPSIIIETEEDWERMVKESEESGIASEEEVKKAFSVWES